MSETNYINTYLNLTVETLHSYLNDILQLRTQVMLNENLVKEKDQALVSLQEEMDRVKNDLKNQQDSFENERASFQNERSSLQNDQGEMQKLRENAANWEFQYNSMVNKVSHMETLTNQYNDLKRQFVEKDEEIERLKNEIKDMKLAIKISKKEEKKVIDTTSKKAINREDNKSSQPIIPIVKLVEEPKEIDDF